MLLLRRHREQLGRQLGLRRLERLRKRLWLRKQLRMRKRLWERMRLQLQLQLHLQRYLLLTVSRQFPGPFRTSAFAAALCSQRVRRVSGAEHGGEGRPAWAGRFGVPLLPPVSGTGTDPPGRTLPGESPPAAGDGPAPRS